MRKFTIALVCTLPMVMAGQAVAGGYDNCTDKPRSEWKAQEDAMAAARKAGYDARRMKISGTCYEVYGVGADGVLNELFYNPVTMKLMHTVKKG